MIRISAAAIAALGAAACAGVPAERRPIPVQILAINDFHGNLEAPESPVTIHMMDGSAPNKRFGGASALAGTIKQIRSRPHSITVSAGDLIGASPLVSAYFLDEPTIAAMNAIGLELNAVGNHEFDKGSAELRRMQTGGCEKHTTRVPCRVEPFKGARFRFLAANVRKADGSTVFPGTAVRRFGPVTIGFIGMTLKETGMLVTPAGVAGLSFADEAATANALVPALAQQGADTIVLLIHQGGKLPDTYRQAGCDGLSGAILEIMERLDPRIEIVVSGHSHNAYACELDRGGANRLLTSSGRYGYMVTDIRLEFDPRTHRLSSRGAINVPVHAGAGGDWDVARLVKRYADAAAPAAARVVGRLAAPAPRSDGESPAANLIADAQLAATRAPGGGDADIGFINATGVRTDLVPLADGSITYGAIFALQPFGNNLVVKTLTGAQLKAVLEQQFRVEKGETTIGSLLVPSQNFRFAYDPSRPAGRRIVSMELDGQPILPNGRYRVTLNNFLASGGDGFSVLSEGADTFDAGLDLDALEAWLATNPPVPAVGRITNLAQPSGGALR